MEDEWQLDEYLNYCGRRNCADSTIRNYDSTIRQLAGMAQGSPLSRDLLDKWFARICQTYSPASVKTLRQMVSTYLRWLEKHHLDGWNISECRTFLLEETRVRRQIKLPVVLSQREVSLLLRQYDSGDYKELFCRQITEICYLTLRIGETLALTRADIDLSNGIIHVRDGKGGKARDIPVFGRAAKRLADFLRKSPLCFRYLFPSALEKYQSDRHYNMGSFNRSLAQHCRAGKVTVISSHSLRRSGATHMFERGMRLEHIQQILGHSSIETTKLYVRYDYARAQEAMRQFHPCAEA